MIQSTLPAIHPSLGGSVAAASAHWLRLVMRLIDTASTPVPNA